MLKTGAQHLECLRDGRVVYVGGERVDDVTTHPAFREGARSMAAIYDMKCDPANLELMAYEENGERFSTHYLRPRSKEDLRKRTMAHKKIADLTYGLLGRSPDHVAGLITGLAMKPEVLDAAGPNYAGNLLAQWEHMRKNDIYAAFAVIPPAGTRHPEIHQEENRIDPGLHVVDEDADGVVLTGMKMLATGAILADEVLIGNLIPLAPEFGKHAITCCIPCNSPGMALWSRRPYATTASSELDYPLSYRFDETDCVVVCENVKVPWEKVILHDHAELSRGCYVMTPANCIQNHQSNVRFWSKMSLLVGIASRICQSTGNDKISGVRELLGRLAALEATIAAMVHGQIDGCEDWPGGPEGYVTYNRRYMYAALNWCQENHTMIIDLVRELAGGNLMQMPADETALADPVLRQQFETYFATPFMAPVDRWKLLKLAWDLIGSEFAGRHQLYEKFYAGSSYVVRNQSFREAPSDEFHATVDDAIARVTAPEPGSAAAE
jgi:4-hydroxyphenylacetate 3-monooxygenase